MANHNTLIVRWAAFLFLVLPFYVNGALTKATLQEDASSKGVLTQEYCDFFYKGQQWCKKCADGKSLKAKMLQFQCDRAKAQAKKLKSLFPETKDAPCLPTPTLPTPAPTLPTPAPTLPTPAPTSPTPAPTLPTPAPTLPTPAPTLPTPAPTLPTPAPTLPTPPKCEDTPFPAPEKREDPTWYSSLRASCAKANWTEFAQSDFEKGTIRIKKGGCYRLKEDILFEPLGGCCDYWPRFRTSNEAGYPMGPYALGFFAAITIEADNVLLDLHGHTIEASLEFSLKQRFFNVIQFSSRVFEAHDGMDALNLQNGEPLAVQGRSPDEDDKDENENVETDENEEIQCKPYPYLNQPNRPPTKVILRNGVVGRSSHNCIHGNGGPRFVVIEDIVARGFEVAGIQFNGAKDLIIRRCTVGPGGKALVNGLFSSTRFIGFWFAFYYKKLWTSEERKVLLKDNYITFADRPGQKINMFDVFKRLFLAEQLLVEDLEGPHVDLPEDPAEEGEDPEDPLFDELDAELEALEAATPQSEALWQTKEQLLKEARQLFLTDDGLTDGGALYGINLHRRRKGVHRLGGEDWNFYGPDEDSTINAQIYDVVIQNLTTAPVEIPALQHTNGICTGGTGEVVRIADWADYDGQFSLGTRAQYRGNMHSDAMVAFFKLANDFWQYSVWGISPEPKAGDAPGAEGPLYDESYLCGLNERTMFNPPTPSSECPKNATGPRACEDLMVLHKRFFGSVKFSRELYQWATVGLEDGLQTMLKAVPNLQDRRSTAHTIACGGDTMHHFAKGVFGLKVDFGSQIDVWNVTVAGLMNKGDHRNFFCENHWTIIGDGGSVGPSSTGYRGTDVHGAVITKSFNVSLVNVTVDYLHSEEGGVIGFDLIGDENGRSQYIVPHANAKTDLRFRNVTIGSHIQAGAAGDLSPIVADLTSFDLGGFKALEGPNLPNTWNIPRTVLTFFPGGDHVSLPASDEDLKMADLNVLEVMEYLQTYYGVEADSSELVPIKESGDTTLKSMCYANETCLLPPDCEVIDVYFKYVIPPGGKLVRGSYAGHSSARQLEEDDELRVGTLVVKRFSQDGPVIIHYYSLNPERQENVFVNKQEREHTKVMKRTKRSFEYGLFSPALGHGRAVGIVLSTTFDSGVVSVSGTSLFLFDNMFQNFQLYSPEVSAKAKPKSSIGDYKFYMDTRADGRFVDFSPLSADTVPLTSHYFLTHEAGVKDMRRWLNETDAEIAERRLAFAKLLQKRFDIITTPFDEAIAKSLDNEVSGIVPYTANHDTDLRVTSMGNETFVAYLTTARLIEVGFMYSSSEGLIKQGVYIVEHPSAEFPGATKFRFKTITPSTVNVLGHTLIHEEISFEDENAKTCEGVYEAVSIQHSCNQNWKGQTRHWDIVGSFMAPKVYN